MTTSVNVRTEMSALAVPVNAVNRLSPGATGVTPTAATPVLSVVAVEEARSSPAPLAAKSTLTLGTLLPYASVTVK